MLKNIYRNTSSVTSRHDLLSSKGSHRYEEWHSDLLGCCSEPLLCMFLNKVLYSPCHVSCDFNSHYAKKEAQCFDACKCLITIIIILGQYHYIRFNIEIILVNAGFTMQVLKPFSFLVVHFLELPVLLLTDIYVSGVIFHLKSFCLL